MMRLGGPGLSLEAFANAKSKSNHYNPALMKKQREFYKSAKYVNKFKKQLKRQSQPLAARNPEDTSETGEASKMGERNKLNQRSYSLKQVYEKQHEEKEKERIEKEAMLRAKKEVRENAEARRKDAKAKMFKKTRYGQPVMKYRIEHLLQTIQGST
uniref:Stress response protein nst1-like n=1 Tax=Rhizophora mucronata TaxID=61149 RepID=A0A2P2JZ38_RHIMU